MHFAQKYILQLLLSFRVVLNLFFIFHPISGSVFLQIFLKKDRTYRCRYRHQITRLLIEIKSPDLIISWQRMHHYHLFLRFSQQPRGQNETVVHLQNVKYFESRFPVAQSLMKNHSTLGEQFRCFGICLHQDSKPSLVQTKRVGIFFKAL